MSDWYSRNAGWFAPVSLVTFLILLVLLLVYQGPGEQYRTAKAQQGTTNELDGRCKHLNVPEKLIECLQSQIQTQRVADDLHVQQSMARYAYLMLWVTGGVGFWSVLITSIGVYLVRATLVEAQQTAKAAVAGAEEAREANRLAKLLALNAGRPFLFIETVSHNALEWRQGNGAFEWHFRFVNYGANPALIDGVEAGVCLAKSIPNPQSDYEPLIRRTDKADAGYVVAGGDPTVDYSRGSTLLMRMGKTYTQQENAERQRIYRDTVRGDKHALSMWLVGIIKYRDFYDRRFETNFCLRLTFPFGKITEKGGTEYNRRT